MHTACTFLLCGRSRSCVRLLDFHIILAEELFYTVKLKLFTYVFTMLYSSSHTVLINSILIINNLLTHSSSGKFSQCIKRDIEIGIFLPALCLLFSHLSSFKPNSKFLSQPPYLYYGFFINKLLHIASSWILSMLTKVQGIACTGFLGS